MVGKVVGAEGRARGTDGRCSSLEVIEAGGGRVWGVEGRSRGFGLLSRSLGSGGGGDIGSFSSSTISRESKILATSLAASASVTSSSSFSTPVPSFSFFERPFFVVSVVSVVELWSVGKAAFASLSKLWICSSSFPSICHSSSGPRSARRSDSVGDGGSVLGPVRGSGMGGRWRGLYGID